MKSENKIKKLNNNKKVYSIWNKNVKNKRQFVDVVVLLFLYTFGVWLSGFLHCYYHRSSFYLKLIILRLRMKYYHQTKVYILN